MFHVDDLNASCSDINKLKALENILIREFGDEHIKCVYGNSQEYLGMLFEYTKDRRVKVSMRGYIQAVLDYCITNCWNTCQIPQNSKIINKEKYSHHATHLLKVAFFQRVQ